MPHKRWAPGDHVIATDFNPNVADQVVATYPNAAARASEWGAVTPPTGAVSAVTDTGRLEIWDGTAWRRLTPSFAMVAITSGTANVATAGPCTVDAFAGSIADLTLPAVAGDLLEYTYHAAWTNNASVYGWLDVYNVNGGRYWSSGTTTGDPEGLRGLGANVTGGTTFGPPGCGTAFYTVVAGDLASGSIICRPRIGASNVNRGIAAPGASGAAKFYLRNLGRQG